MHFLRKNAFWEMPKVENVPGELKFTELSQGKLQQIAITG